MKIIKFPSETKINCKCGCEFEFDEKDTRQEKHYWGTVEEYIVYVVCPFCGKKIELKRYNDEIASY